MAKSKSKGDRGEREVARIFSEWWGENIVRTPQSGGFATKKFRDDWNAGSDIVCPDPDFPFSVEVKNREGWELDAIIHNPKCPIWEWWEQTILESPEGKLPLLVFKRNRRKWTFMTLNKVVQHPMFLPSKDSFSMLDPNGRSIRVGGLIHLCSFPKDTWLK